MPSPETIFNWFSRHEGFVAQYARATEERTEALVEEMLSIADDAESDPDANSRRLRVDTRKWIASKLKPKKYGDTTGLKLSVDTGGGEHSLTELLIGFRQEKTGAKE